MHSYVSSQNFLFATKDEDAPMKVIDFGLSDFIRPGTFNFSSTKLLLYLCIRLVIISSP